MFLVLNEQAACHATNSCAYSHQLNTRHICGKYQVKFSPFCQLLQGGRRKKEEPFLSGVSLLKLPQNKLKQWNF